MKMIFAIINDNDVKNVMNELSRNQYPFTNLSSSGGFLKSGNTTLVIGVEPDKVDEVISIIKANSSSRKHIIDSATIMDHASGQDGVSYTANAELEKGGGITIAGATIFVTDAEKG
jgi:uncharacterized protein YaaQ